MSRVHVGCGTHNPWRNWMWYTLAFALVTSIPVDILTLSLWGMLGYLPWLTSLVLITRWERIHTVEKMYRTWFP